MNSYLKKLILSFLPIIFVVGLDRLSKSWAIQLESSFFWGPVKFKQIFNQGFILGSFSDLSLNAKEAVLYTFGLFSYTFYLISIFVLPIRSKSTYLGLSLFMGGISGNLIDRAVNPGVIDFFSLNVYSIKTPYLNLADLFQIFSYILICVGIYRDSLYYWPQNDWRVKYIINKKFQLKSSFLIASMTFFTSSTSFVFSFYFLRSNHPSLTLKTFIVVGFMITFSLSALSFFFSLYLTHRVAGPIYAIQRNLRNLLSGKFDEFKLRNHDEFKDLETEMNLLQKKFLKMNTDIFPNEKSKESDIT